MHSMLVLIDISAPLDTLQDAFTEFAHALKVREGLVMKTWIVQEDSSVGGFYIFADRVSAESYIEEMLAPTVEAHPATSNMRLQHFGVLSELSELTGSPVASAVQR
jgi:hypothetical protein